MKNALTVRFWLYAGLFAFVVVAVAFGVIGDNLESRITEPSQKNNELHHRIQH